MDLNEIQKRVKRLDYEVVRILNQRMELALRASRLKEEIVEAAAEKDILENVDRIPDRLVGKPFIRELFNGIITESRRLRRLDRKLVGFQGEHGANSDVAVRAAFSQLLPIPCMKFIDVFEEVKNGWFDYGLVPVENSLEGGVTEVNDLLIKEDLHICGEVKLRVRHTFLTLKETDPEGIRVVYSHPQALAQCRDFIHRRGLEDRPFYNTAGAAKMLSEVRPKGSAVIASKLCADIYDLELLEENIEDNSANFTRFALIAREQGKEEGNKCSVVFSTRDECGALNDVLTLFSRAGINLSRIESRPSKKHPGSFVFLVDFNGSINDERIAETLAGVEKTAVIYKLLGCYKEDSGAAHS